MSRNSSPLCQSIPHRLERYGLTFVLTRIGANGQSRPGRESKRTRTKREPNVSSPIYENKYERYEEQNSKKGRGGDSLQRACASVSVWKQFAEQRLGLCH